MARTPAGQAAAPAEPALVARIGQTWRLTYPIIVASLTTVLLAVADSAILGQYSTDALATIGLVVPIYVFASPPADPRRCRPRMRCATRGRTT